jgi:hypothetical protein
MTHGGSGLTLVGGSGICSGSPGVWILLGPTGFLAPLEAWPSVGFLRASSGFTLSSGLSPSHDRRLFSLSDPLSLSVSQFLSMILPLSRSLPLCSFCIRTKEEKKGDQKRREKRKGKERNKRKNQVPFSIFPTFVSLTVSLLPRSSH